MELTGVMGHDAEGDELAPGGKSSAVITIQTPPFPINNQDIFERLLLFF